MSDQTTLLNNNNNNNNTLLNTPLNQQVSDLLKTNTLTFIMSNSSVHHITMEIRLMPILLPTLHPLSLLVLNTLTLQQITNLILQDLMVVTNLQ
jgi:hypothetical protein